MESVRLVPGDYVSHFKRELLSEDDKKTNKYIYRVISTNVKHTETGEILAVYESMEDHNIYARPTEMFFSEVDHNKYPDIKQKYRLEKIDYNER